MAVAAFRSNSVAWPETNDQEKIDYLWNTCIVIDVDRAATLRKADVFWMQNSKGSSICKSNVERSKRSRLIKALDLINRHRGSFAHVARGTIASVRS